MQCSWEISSGQPPFINYEHDYDLAMNIINGIRPKIVLGTPLKYKNLMKQCWDADPLKRPDIVTLLNEMDKLNLYYQNQSNESTQSEENNGLEMDSLENYTSSSRLLTSKVYQFENLSEPRNATEGIIINCIQFDIILEYDITFKNILTFIFYLNKNIK